MISVAEADRLLSDFAAGPGGPWPVESVPLEEAAGRILREDLRADRAYPAQDRSYMDGIAIAFAAWEMGVRRFPVAGLAPAGAPRARLDDVAACVEIMTGAAVPEGADTVIRYEDLAIRDGAAHIRDDAVVRAGQNIHRQGSDCVAGAVLVPAGTRLNAAQVAVAASVGAARVTVARRPRVALVATGDELVGVDETPLPHQLRVSNAHGLAALLAPWADTRLHRCGDDPAALAARLRAVLTSFDMVLVSGGVSAGKFDAVPATLESLGVRQVFHKIAQKPGKPLWFGVMPSPQTSLPLASVEGEGSGVRAVFGLPGNPVSALVCARRYVLPLIWRLSGLAPAPGATACLAAPVTPRALTQFVPVRLEEIDGIRRADPRPVNGSGDFAGLAFSDGFLEIPALDGTESEAKNNVRTAGESMSFFPWFP